MIRQNYLLLDEEDIVRKLSGAFARTTGYPVNTKSPLALDERLRTTPALDRLIDQGYVVEIEAVSSMIAAFTGSTTIRFASLTDKGMELANSLE